MIILKKENIKERNPNGSQIYDKAYRILILWEAESGKASSLFNLISHEPYNDEISLNVKNVFDTELQLLTLFWVRFVFG